MLQSPAPPIKPSAPDLWDASHCAIFAKTFPFFWNAFLALSGKLLFSLQAPMSVPCGILSDSANHLLFPEFVLTIFCLNLICCPVILYYIPWLFPSPNCETLQGKNHINLVYLWHLCIWLGLRSVNVCYINIQVNALINQSHDVCQALLWVLRMLKRNNLLFVLIWLEYTLWLRVPTERQHTSELTGWCVYTVMGW